jgi:hypothetical protein
LYTVANGVSVTALGKCRTGSFTSAGQCAKVRRRDFHEVQSRAEKTRIPGFGALRALSERHAT